MDIYCPNINNTNMNNDYDDGWFKIQFRCNRVTFDKIAHVIQLHWLSNFPALGKNTYFKIRDRIAVVIHYLTHGGSIIDSASLFGCSKASTVRFIWQVYLSNK